MAGSSLTWAEKLGALRGILSYRARFTFFIVFFSTIAAILEGIGISFLVPIINVATSGAEAADGNGRVMALFIRLFKILGIPLTLEYVIVGVASVMVVRFFATFAIHWLRELLRVGYIRDLREETFQAMVGASVSYFDIKGSDDILNAIITQTEYAGAVIARLVNFFKELLMVFIYIGIAFYIAPVLTAASGVILGFIAVVFRFVFEPGESVGDRVAAANEQIQRIVQGTTQGIRDVKMFGVQSELVDRFTEAANRHADSLIQLRRNKAATTNFYRLVTALAVFVLIYIAIEFINLNLSSLSVFLFAMFRLSPRVSTISGLLYNIEGDLPHYVRTQEFLDSLMEKQERLPEGEAAPEVVDELAFENVSFAYNEEQVLHEVSFNAKSGEFIAFVGQSGAGKSSVASLLAGLYEPDDGQIRINNRDLMELNLNSWRSRVAFVRQSPFIFNDTLRYNLTLGQSDVSEADIKKVCDIAQVTEFLNSLPDGYKTNLGDNGTQLSGGQRQRVALARALLQDAEVLILDEATSDLDTQIERQVQESLEAMEDDRILITIAHRLSTVRNADRIYAMADGKIVESGRHGQLIDDGGEYASLYATQHQ